MQVLPAFHTKYPHQLFMVSASVALLVLLSCFNACTNLDRSANGKDQQAQSKKTDGRVVAISDGDTFRLLTNDKKTVRIRMHGIDAPEKGQDFGTRSREVLSELIFSKDVRIEQKSKDRYGRIVAIVYTNGLNVNEEMLRRGMVWHYKEYDKNPDWAKLEQWARSKKMGLWQQYRPTPPWQFRKEKRTGQKVKAGLGTAEETE
jgi:endonuclease YncB( thermonuclease family)